MATVEDKAAAKVEEVEEGNLVESEVEMLVAGKVEEVKAVVMVVVAMAAMAAVWAAAVWEQRQPQGWRRPLR